MVFLAGFVLAIKIAILGAHFMEENIKIKAFSSFLSENLAWNFIFNSEDGLDFCGKTQFETDDTEGWICLESSTFFSPAWYEFLPELLKAEIKVFVKDSKILSNVDIFSYLTHIGVLLLATEAKDSLLVGELFMRRYKTFEKFESVTKKILDSIAVEAFFSVEFGRTQKHEIKIDSTETDFGVTQLLYKIVNQKLDFDPTSETLEMAFVRYFSENKSTFTLPIVGMGFHPWSSHINELDMLSNNLNAQNFIDKTTQIRNSKHIFYDSLKAHAQIEPYNINDSFAIAIFLEDISAMLKGCGGKVKAGYFRRMASSVIRKARPDLFCFDVKLCRMSKKNTIIKIILS